MLNLGGGQLHLCILRDLLQLVLVILGLSFGNFTLVSHGDLELLVLDLEELHSLKGFSIKVQQVLKALQNKTQVWLNIY